MIDIDTGASEAAPDKPKNPYHWESTEHDAWEAGFAAILSALSTKEGGE